MECVSVLPEERDCVNVDVEVWQLRCRISRLRHAQHRAPLCMLDVSMNQAGALRMLRCELLEALLYFIVYLLSRPTQAKAAPQLVMREVSFC